MSAMEYENENGRYDDDRRYDRDRSASPRGDSRADRDRSLSPSRNDDRAPAGDSRKSAPGNDDEDEGAVNPGSNLFVTGIHPRLTEADISRLFEKYGDVESCSIMLDPHTKESRGFGFVKMVTAEQADAAKEGLQGEVIDGLTLSIEKARRSRPRTPTPGKYFGPPKRDPRRGPSRGGRDRYDDRRGYGGGSRRYDDYRYGRYDSYGRRGGEYRDDHGYRGGGGREYGRDYGRDYGRRDDYRDDYGSYRGGAAGGSGGDRYGSREERYPRGGEERRGGDDRRSGYYDRDANPPSYDQAPPRENREPYNGGGSAAGGRSYEGRGEERYGSR
ncbi:transformer-SR ribonucleoprotein, putative [Talaromyces stipitatus ATCC 10500]|uniref:Transformer-SR ribonucleoprotein, putative n=1 Tax=Talaromyces stipitatus (strain ATCC 10500 / CBS 375.48 / QM 6759 / NRRL 1006) TaxID=441959 RepID=B8MFL2_TALSN|nr:transformer-SR ribonucleoprotein, putative [Talaromyces stipitatus ATCC 10500]EED17002.1 transformer-SR ribonucleoprotein, putative [Talaromyces stipitatus ATCC 10500]